MATPQSIRYLNALRALNVLFRGGGMSRADLARALGGAVLMQQRMLSVDDKVLHPGEQGVAGATGT